MSDEPTLGRWTDAGSEAPEELRDLLAHGRAALGSPAELERLQASLARALGPAAGLAGPSGEGGPLPASGVARQAAGAGGALSRWLFGGGVAGGLLAAVVAWNALRPSPVQPAELPSVSATPTISTPSEPERRAELAAIEAAPLPSVQPSRAPVPAASAKRPTARPSKPGARAEDEAALLERARAALDGAPARALALTQEHQRRFPRGALIQEREVIAIEALERLGQERAAGAKASEFDQRFRGSVHQERVRTTSAPAAPEPKIPPR